MLAPDQNLQTAASPDATLFDEVVSRLDAFGVDENNVEMDAQGRVCLDPNDMMRVLEFEANTGFRSPYALGRALDTRRAYEHMGILAIRLDLSTRFDVGSPADTDAALRYISKNVRELDACYRCIDTTLVMLLPETGTKSDIIGAARRIRMALSEIGINADIGAAATRLKEGAHGHEYMGSALIALVDAMSEPERIAFVEV